MSKHLSGGDRLAGFVMRGFIVLSMALIILPAGATTGATKDDGTSLRTPISDMPWDLKSIVDDGKVVYGTDDRIDVYQETNGDRIDWAASTCALVDTSALTDNGNGTYSLATSAYVRGGYPPCSGEPFANQPTAARCTGFKVNNDIIASAGQCIQQSDLPYVRFVFGFDMLNAATPVLTFNADQIYTGTAIIAWQYGVEYDYSVVRVDRPITVAASLPLRTEGAIAVGAQVGVIGHPSGLPKKIAFGANTLVRSNTAAGYFEANLDTYGGNFGSPVFNAAEGIVEGILVRGNEDFVFGADCFRSNVLPDTTLDSEDVSKSITFADWVYGTVEAPENDLCENATAVTLDLVVTGSSLGATGTDVTSCANGDYADVWFSFTAPTAGNYLISLCGSDYDTVLGVFQGACGSLTEVGCNDDGGDCGYASQLCLWLEASPYYIRIAGYNGAVGNYSLNITETDTCEPCESPYAEDTAYPSYGLAPLEVYFENTSTNGDSCYWDFGDGTISYDWSPTHTFINPGEYWVLLEVYNDCGIDDYWLYVTVVDCYPPYAYFEASPLTGEVPLTVAFTNISDNVDEWYWEFGDGSSGYDWDTTHTYTDPGTYQACLYGWNECGQNTYCVNINAGIEPSEGEVPVPHPADLNEDWHIVLGEAIAYLAGWQQGTNPIGYAIRAAYLWQNGEGYLYNGSLTPPTCWELAP